jgi:3-methyladenine DNA glycosylase Tag
MEVNDQPHASAVLPQNKEAVVPSIQEAGWVATLVWMFYGIRWLVVHAKNRKFRHVFYLFTYSLFIYSFT